METLSSYFAINDIPGHLSYIIFAISYYMTSILWLRVTAVIALFLEIVYYAMTSVDLYAGIGWNVVFVAINLYQIAVLLRHRYGSHLAGPEGMLLRQTFASLDPSQVASILKCGAVREVNPRECITMIDQPVDRLFLLARGVMAVDVNGTLIAHLTPGAFIGEMAYLTGASATATVYADGPCQVLEFYPDKLARLCSRDGQIDSELHRLIGRDLAAKISRAGKSSGRVARPAVSGR